MSRSFLYAAWPSRETLTTWRSPGCVQTSHRPKEEAHSMPVARQSTSSFARLISRAHWIICFRPTFPSRYSAKNSGNKHRIPLKRLEIRRAFTVGHLHVLRLATFQHWGPADREVGGLVVVLVGTAAHPFQTLEVHQLMRPQDSLVYIYIMFGHILLEGT